MKIERGIATERLKLLRLTAGLLLAVVFISAAPFSSACRRHLQEIVFSILTRAEAAMQFLIIAQARVIADEQGLDFDGMHLLQSAAEPKQDSGEALPTPAALRRRLNALRAVLKNLRRHGLRLLRRVNGTRGGCGDGAKPLTRRRGPLRVLPSLTDPIDRPPDKALRFILTAFSLPPERGRKALAVGPRFDGFPANPPVTHSRNCQKGLRRVRDLTREPNTGTHRTRET